MYSIVALVLFNLNKKINNRQCKVDLKVYRMSSKTTKKETEAIAKRREWRRDGNWRSKLWKHKNMEGKKWKKSVDLFSIFRLSNYDCRMCDSCDDLNPPLLRLKQVSDLKVCQHKLAFLESSQSILNVIVAEQFSFIHVLSVLIIICLFRIQTIFAILCMIKWMRNYFHWNLHLMTPAMALLNWRLLVATMRTIN